MRRRRGPCEGTPKSQARQSDLFGPPQGANGQTAPIWEALPEQTRRTLTGLMARLLLEHGGNLRRAGGRHDL
jgi:hypothetical protein